MGFVIEVNEQVDVTVGAVFTSGYAAKHSDISGVMLRREEINLVTVRGQELTQDRLRRKCRGHNAMLPT